MEGQIRTLPQNIEAEQSVLASMINDKEATAEAAQELSAEDFYRESHKVIFTGIVELFFRDIPIDMITLIEHLKSTDKLEASGGISYISTLSTSIASTANVHSYIKIVKDKAVLRRLIKVANEITEDSYTKQNDVAKVMDSAEKKIFDIAQNKTRNDYEPIASVLSRSFEQLEYVANNSGGLTGVPSGFTALDGMTSGFQKSDMILIAARPSMGKTTFALNLAQHAAIRENKSIVIFSLEMSKEQLVQKLLCAEANIDMVAFRNGSLDDKSWDNIAKAAGPLGASKIFIDDTAGVSVMEMRSKCRRIKLEHGIDMVLIDYLQLMSGSGESRQQEVSEISRSIKALAKEMQCPVIALSQLSRAPEQRADHRPMLSDLRESGSIEQDADVVMFLYRDEYYNKESEDKGVAECIIAKQRNGPVGTVKLNWAGQYSKFIDPEPFMQQG
ncbi:replicative DNA helicase [Clostridium cellulovorans]|uniref:Replicative DNA helicase n=1 Tax=Clostridium cellulovorans (strain ATCC 35296 / DSM 3052 / OCM 3 / 743B) TaxID=573061 RepID=D9SPB4_CLOC7|nr:replicative DNA helicase [Clostridium cellulovorans]ADL54016.1 replicative DNA helicase [Clostridium cellulovorans 743B]